MRRSERGGILVGLLVTGLVLVCCAIATAVFVVRNVHISARDRGNGGDVSIDTPVGHLSVHGHDDSAWPSADIPKYPGAWRGENHGGGAVVQWNTRDGVDRGFSVSGAEMITSDPSSKVLEYYRNELPDWVVAHDGDGSVRLELKSHGHKQIVSIHQRDDGTHIGVASVGEPASN